MNDESKNPNNCQFHSSSCGDFSPRRNRLGCVVLKDLTQNCAYLFGADIELSEKDLICMRSPIPLHPNGLICGKHQFTLGIHYRPSTVCKFYLHPKNSKATGLQISWVMYELAKSFDSTFILGSLICKKCQVKLLSMQNEVSDICDKDYNPSVPIIDDDEKKIRREKLDKLTEIFEIDRVRFQLTSDVTNVSNTTLNYFRCIHRKLLDKLTDVFCNLVAPGLEQQMKEVIEDTNVEKDNSNSTLLHLKKSFESCSSRQARISILTLVPKQYSKVEVSGLFGCTIYEITKARSISKRYGKCEVEPKNRKVYSRLSVEKCKHFINFLFTTELLQEVAYGTTNLKLDSGEKLSISNTILNGIHEHAVKEYKIHCEELNYEPLCRTTLLNMLNKMKPRTRKKLAGVDSFVVEGVEAFEALRTSLRLLGDDIGTKELLKLINSSEGYLKARFKGHCNFDDSCSSHCIKHALSHPTDKDLSVECEHSHSLNCDECVSLSECIKFLELKILKLPESHPKDIALYQIANARTKIMDWQKHIMRGVQQSKARSDALNKLDSTTALWIRDFAQKYLPTKTLEAMSDYFGKRGMTVSVEVFIFKAFGSYVKQVYLVALDRCEQNSVETLCIADIVLQQFRYDFPEISELTLKSDNAGNYHANGVPESMYRLAARQGIVLSAYNYNEAQQGKDQCDREAAIFNSCAEKWLLTSKSNKITTATELLEAVFSNGGPTNTKMCVLSIDKAVTFIGNVKKITNISYYHSVEFQTTGALYREFYGIGKGKFYEYNADKTFVSGASFVTDWKNSDRHGKMTQDSRKQNSTFHCPTPFCIVQFSTENELIHHTASNDHKYATAKTPMDNALLYYAIQKSLLNIPSADENPYMDVENDGDNDSNISEIYNKGWARKVRTVKKLSLKHKEYFEKLFINGAKNKKKLSAEQMVEAMKDEIVDGKYYFSPAEYLDPKRVKSFIASLTKKQKSLPTAVNSSEATKLESEDDGIQQNLEDICDFVLYSDDEPDFYGFDNDEQ